MWNTGSPPEDCANVYLSSTPAGELVLMLTHPREMSNETASVEYGVVLGLPQSHGISGQHAALLAPGGELCVLSQGGVVHWMSKGVNDWHSYQDERALRYEL